MSEQDILEDFKATIAISSGPPGMLLKQEQLDELISEVERLRFIMTTKDDYVYDTNDQRDRTNNLIDKIASLTKERNEWMLIAQEDGHAKIDSLTKERDELRLNIANQCVTDVEMLECKIGSLEVENAELKKKVDILGQECLRRGRT